MAAPKEINTNHVIIYLFCISLFIGNLFLQFHTDLLRVGNPFDTTFRVDEELNYNANTIERMFNTSVTTGVPVTLINMILGTEIVEARGIIMIYFLVGILIIYLITNTLVNAGTMPIILSISSITMITYAMWFVGEIPAITFMLLSIYFILKENIYSSVMGSIFCALAILTKSQMIVLIPAIVIYSVYYSKPIVNIIYGLLIILIPYNIFKLQYLGIDVYISDLNLILNAGLANTQNSYINRDFQTYILNTGRLILDNIILVILGIIYLPKLGLRTMFKNSTIGLISMILTSQVILYLVMPYGDRYGLAIIPLVSILISYCICKDVGSNST